MKTIVFGVLLCVVLLGCASPYPEDLARESTLSGENRPNKCGSSVATTKIHWRDAVKKDDPSIVVKINGVEGKFLLDTGTSHHLLFKQFLDRAGLAYSDGYNASIIKLVVGESTVKADQFIAIDTISPLAVDGFSGILSAARLAEAGPLLLDMKGSRLWLDMAENITYEHLIRCRSLDADQSVAIPWVARSFGVVYSPVAILGQRDILLNVDSGSSLTTIEPALAIDFTYRVAGTTMVNAAGVKQTTEALENVRIDIGGLSVNVPLLLILPDTQSLPDGTKWRGKLGMDVLREFQILLPQQGKDEVILFR